VVGIVDIDGEESSNRETPMYSADFYRLQKNASFVSAQRIVPVINKILSLTSVIDLGCGVGTFLKVFLDNGIKRIVGVDGPWVDKSQLYIPESSFIEHDFKIPFNMDSRFDLAMSLEVAEHLDKEAERNLIGSLVRLSRHVLFSAAVPCQGGANHINEQWQSYWVKCFSSFDFDLVDIIRPLLWPDSEITGPYRQNMLLFVAKDDEATIHSLRSRYKENIITDIVHPQAFVYKVNEHLSLRYLIARLAKQIIRRGDRNPGRL
jgi:SAM-dependent methyltransferase